MALSLKKHEMPVQDPQVRAHNFDEVALGYTEEMAMQEAARCLDCKNSPCRSGCPVAVKIPRFLEKVRDGDFDAAYDIILNNNLLRTLCALFGVSDIHDPSLSEKAAGYLLSTGLNEDELLLLKNRLSAD